MDIEQQWNNAANVPVVFRPLQIGGREPAAVERLTG